MTGLRIDHLYLLLPLSLIGLIAGLIPLHPHDFWWHIRVGQLILQEGRVPWTQLFSWSIPLDTPFIYTAWLAEVLHFLLYQVGGLDLVSFSRNALVLATFALVGIEAHRRSDSWKLAGLAVLLAGTMSIGNLVVRPQDWAWVPFALFAAILGRYADGQLRPIWLISLPLLMIFWTNVHGSFVLGVILIGAFVVGEALRVMLRQPGALPWANVQRLALVAVVTGLVTVVNPYGLALHDWVLKVLGDAPSVKFGPEWQAPTPSGIYGVFYLSVLLLIVACATAKRRPTATDLLLVCGFLWLAFTGKRYVMWFGIIAMPILAQVLAGSTGPPRLSRPGSPLFNGVLAALIVTPLVLVQPWFVRGLPMGEEYTEQLLPAPAPPLLSVQNPLAAAEYLRANPGGRLFADLGYASYLIWAIPGLPVFVDTRVELYSLQHWEDYFAIGDGQGSLELIARYGADRVLLKKSDQAGLATVLAQAPGWRREYADPWSELWRREAGL
jgi:hypothetical protein